MSVACDSDIVPCMSWRESEAASMADDNTIIEGFVKFREGKKVSPLDSYVPFRCTGLHITVQIPINMYIFTSMYKKIIDYGCTHYV